MSEPDELARAYAICRKIARREAKNFYYAFLALPRAKRDAMCAVYAFMRHADDISDDESMSRDERQCALAAWSADWHSAAGGAVTQDAVFISVRDVKRRFEIPGALFDQLVQGTAMDLEEPMPSTDGQVHTYANFEELYRYCYLVASVVGLVCIRIFGYRDARAEKLAEETGIAFQLTNILRDVREDAERGRIYIPLDEMARHGVTPDALAAQRGGDIGAIPAGVCALLREQAERAWKFYESADKLMPFIDVDSRPALRVLVNVYRRLLQRIEAKDFDVFSQRVYVPTREKWVILLRGVRQALAARMAGAKR